MRLPASYYTDLAAAVNKLADTYSTDSFRERTIARVLRWYAAWFTKRAEWRGEP